MGPGLGSGLGPELRFALRGLRRNPGFTAVAVLTLGLGIGATSAIFSVVNSVLLRPLPYGDPARIVTILHRGTSPVAPANYLDWRVRSRSFQHTAAAQVWRGGTLGGRGGRGGRPEQVRALGVTADLFAVLGVAPALGRPFQPGDDQPGAAPTAVLGHGLWQRRFGGDPKVLGQTITVDGQGHTVVGIMPPGFQFPPFWVKNAELWLPLDLGPRRQDRNGESLRVFARLAPGVSREQAQAETQDIWRRLEALHPGQTRADVVVGPLHERVVGKVRRPLLVLLAAVSFVLLISCANVANLLLARGAARRKELGIRAALGAGRRRLVRQLLAESLLLALLGCGLGVALAWWGVDLLVAFGPRDLPRHDTITVDHTVLVFTLGVSLATVLVFGLGPALRLAAEGGQATLEDGGRGATEGAAGSRLRGLLVIAEVAMALVLSIGAGLMIRSFERMTALEPGFQPEGVLALDIPLPARRDLATSPAAERSPPEEAQDRRAFLQELLARVRALPGVEAASAVNHLPIAGDLWQRGLTVDGAPLLPPGDEPRAVYRVIAPDYLGTLGLTLLRGRDFTEQDGPGSAGVAIVNETMARTLWPGEDPLGKRIRVYDGGPDPRRIVGVVRDLRQREWTAPPAPEMYLAYLQNPSSTATLVVRAAARDPAALAPAVQRRIWALDGQLPASRVTVMEQVVSDAVGQPRFQMVLFNLFGAAALLLAAVGLYGTMAHAVSRRTRELGIRLALGATPRAVVGLVVGQGMALAAVGLALGVAGALASTRLMKALLYGVAPTDPLTFLLVSLVLLAAALVACVVPARRAIGIDPVVALRKE